MTFDPDLEPRRLGSLFESSLPFIITFDASIHSHVFKQKRSEISASYEKLKGFIPVNISSPCAREG